MFFLNGVKKILLGIVLATSSVVLAAVDINTANVAELQQLKGIGAKKAADIVAYREKNGAFKNVDDLSNVKGIGKATVEKLRSEITISLEKQEESKKDDATDSAVSESGKQSVDAANGHKAEQQTADADKKEAEAK